MREQRVLEYLNEFKVITTWEAFNELGNTRLSASIFNLRKDHDIEDIFITGKNRYGDKIKWKAYFFSKDKDIALRKLGIKPKSRFEEIIKFLKREKRRDFTETLMQNFSQEENNESRIQTISNSIITVNSKMYDDPYLTHNFGITVGIPLQENQEYVTLTLKLNNQILSGNIHFGLGFVPDLL